VLSLRLRERAVRMVVGAPNLLWILGMIVDVTMPRTVVGVEVCVFTHRISPHQQIRSQ
jgi:hypothetical protein